MNISYITMFTSNLSFNELAIVGFLCLLTFITIVGNFLVMCAIFVKAKLRQNVTNTFIASLAAADLLLGTVVMPFSIIEFHNAAQMSYLNDDQRRYYVSWPYGQDWCHLWHAFDVLSSTASILNLCVISVERYIAISDPFNYHTRMTHSRALVMIAIAWILSSLISFPAIVWWRYSSAHNNSSLQPTANKTDFITECTFPEDQLYLFLSSCVSFHIPLVVMVLLYWKIYRTATRVMKSLKQGTTVVNGSSKGERLVLRVHRGCSTQKPQSACQSPASPILPNSSCLNEELTRTNDSPFESDISSPVVIGNFNPVDMVEEGNRISDRPVKKRHVRFARSPTIVSNSLSFCNQCCSSCVCCSWSLHVSFDDRNVHEDNLLESADLEESTIVQSDKRKRFFHLKKRLKRFSQEKRAARTLGVIMGAFIFCWLPFFIYNTIKSINPSLIKEHDYIIFPLFTWLGFMNSSINPFIYALSLRDIRRVFRESLCKSCSGRNC